MLEESPLFTSVPYSVVCMYRLIQSAKYLSRKDFSLDTCLLLELQIQNHFKINSRLGAGAIRFGSSTCVVCIAVGAISSLAFSIVERSSFDDSDFLLLACGRG
jgi:hypothetical protein